MHKKGAGLLFSLLLLLSVLTSLFYIADEMHHECEGEDCPVCRCIELCEAHLNRIASGAALIVIPILCLMAVLLCTEAFRLFLPAITPVSERVRMDR